MNTSAKLVAISDLHASHPGNKQVVESIEPDSPEDWLIVAGDVAEKPDAVRWALDLLRRRFAKVVWVPGNHELWSAAKDPASFRGARRYEQLVALCREIDVVTPEDPYPTWNGEGGPALVVPMFLLYDYTFLPPGATTKAEGLEIAERHNVNAMDERLLSHEPYPTREAWCRARVVLTRARLDQLDRDVALVLVNHYPLVQNPTRIVFPQEFSMWCGTELTANWHTTYNVICMVYGHLHLPKTAYYDGVRFEEVSLGYPREWQRRGGLPNPVLRQILPVPDHAIRPLSRWGRWARDHGRIVRGHLDSRRSR